LEDQAAEGERVCVWDCESTELVQTGTHISDMEISVVSCLLLNINAALRNPEAEVRRAMKEDLYSFWNERSGRGAPLTLLGLLLGHTKHNVAYNANFDLSISKKHLTTDAYAHARQHNLDPFARLRSAYGTSHKLSHLLQSNGLPDKSGAGSEAPTLWRQRRLDELLKYNVGDVELLARLVLLKALRLPDGRQTAIGTLAAMLPAAPAKFSASDSRALAQGSPEWFAARKHKITASLAPALLGFGFLTREDAFEVLMGTGETEEETPAMRRGQALEPVAAEAYARRTGQTVAATGLWVDSSRPWLAASPDRLVGSHGLLEVKSPAKISEPSAAMVIQVQIQLLVTGRFWCDLLQYTVNGEQRVDRLFPDSSLVKLLLSYLEPIADAALEAVATGNEEGTFIPEMSIHEKRELRDEVKESLQSHRRRM
jgi:putative phage-type endonuclease